MRFKKVDMDSPRLFRSIILYSLPLILITIVQSLFNSVDMIMLDAFDTSEGSLAVASIGATSSIVHLIVNSFFGISSGTKIVLAHQLGADHRIQVRRTVSTSIITAAVLGAVISATGFFLSGAFLTATKCPADCFEGARIYLQVYMLGVPAIMLYNFASAILTASGDTKSPLYYMLISGSANVLLNFIFLLILPQKVVAVAVATALSQVVGAALALAKLIRNKNICSLNLRALKWHFGSFVKILKVGLPIAFNSSLLPFSNLQIQTQINELGSAIVAGSSAASNLESIVSSFGSSAISGAVGVFVSYNIGAKRPDRVKKSIVYCLILAFSITTVMSAIIFGFSRPLASLYVTGDDAVRAAQTRMFTNVVFHFIVSTYSVLAHVIQAFGYSYVSALNSILAVFAFRIAWTYTVYPIFKDLTAPFKSFFWLAVCWPISWTLLLVANAIIFLILYYGKFKKNKLKNVG